MAVTNQFTRFIAFLLFSLLPVLAHGQQAFRIKADFTIKETSDCDEVGQLVSGKVYYDTNHKKIYYNLSFPYPEEWVLKDTVIQKFSNNKLVLRETIPHFSAMSFFHMCLSSNLNNFGLNKSPFTIKEVSKDKGLVITTWLPPKQLDNIVGEVVISQKNGQLQGIVFIDPTQKIVNKQVFKHYKTVKGLQIPTESTQVSFWEGKEIYRTTTLKNIVINETGNAAAYNHKFYE